MNLRMKHFTEIKVIYIALILVLIVVVGIGVLTYRSINGIFHSFEDKKQNYEVLSTMEDAMTRIAIAEEGQRSYFLTGNTVYLPPYNSSRIALKTDIVKLKNDFNRDSSNLKEINKFDSLVSERFANLDQRISLQQGNVNIIIGDIKSGTSKEYMDNVRKLVSALESYEYSMLNSSDKNSALSIRRTSVTVLAGTLISCIIFLIIFYMLTREIFERKGVETEIRKEKEFTDRLINSSLDGIIAFDKELRFTLWNPGMEILSGIKEDKVRGKKILEVFPLLKKIGADQGLYETLNGNNVIIKDKFYSIPQTHRKGYIEAYLSPIYDPAKNVVGGLVIIRDRTQRKLDLEAIERAKRELEKRVQDRTSALSNVNEELRKEIKERVRIQKQINNSLQEKVILLREIHHRVKNNLQVISSLLNLQSSYIQDKKSLEIFRESQNRVRSMALIHEKLYRSKSLNKIEFNEYINLLARDLFSSYSVESRRVNLIVDLKGTFMEIDSGILCGLILNELISNSLKYAFPDGRKGEIYISINKEDNNYNLIVRDNGVGFPDGLDFRKTDSLGLQLVTSLTEQLNGHVELNRNGCTEFRIMFPASAS
jgi:PAS domain S-box-containing protein